MESNEGVKMYSVEDLIALANNGTCIVPQDKPADKVCAEPSKGAFFNPNTLAFGACKTVCYDVRNTTADPLYFGLGGGFAKPGLDPLYAISGSVFTGKYGVDNAGFLVGGPNALALQALQQICPNFIISALRLVREPNDSELLNAKFFVERYSCAQGRCEADFCPPICDLCGGNNSTRTTVSYKIGLKAANSSNAFGILVPGEGDDAPTHQVEIDIAFTEKLFGYVPGCN